MSNHGHLRSPCLKDSFTNRCMLHSGKAKVGEAFLLLNTKAFSFLFIHMYGWIERKRGFSFSSSSNHARIDTLFWCFFASSLSRSMLTRQPVIRNLHWERIWTGKKMYIDVMMVSTNPEGIHIRTHTHAVRSMCDISPPFASHACIHMRHWRDKDNTRWPIRPSH